jgi:hypothetical protein
MTAATLNMTQDVEEAAELADTMGPLDKLMTADMARLMGDNQRVLDSAYRRSQAFANWEAKKVLGETMPEPTDDMQISIDSPVTTTHHHAAPVVPQQGNGISKLMAGAALAAGLIGIPGAGIAGYLLSKLGDKPAVTKPTEDNTVDLGLRHWDEFSGR